MVQAEQRLAELLKKKLLCQNANRADLAAQLRVVRDDTGDVADKMAWTAAQWDQYELRRRVNSEGYKNLSDLAHATYAKEVGRRDVDMDKYASHMAGQESNYGLDVYLGGADAEAVAQTLRDASERKQKRRRTGEGGDYITEKNRQFNMKLEREYNES